MSLHFNSSHNISGNPHMVQLLLDSKDIDVNIRDSTGDTPIMYAAYGKGIGNNSYTPTWQNQFYFQRFFLLGRQKVFELLINKGANVNNVNHLGESTLFFVARFGGKYKQIFLRTLFLPPQDQKIVAGSKAWRFIF